MTIRGWIMFNDARFLLPDAQNPNVQSLFSVGRLTAEHEVAHYLLRHGNDIPGDCWDSEEHFTCAPQTQPAVGNHLMTPSDNITTRNMILNSAERDYVSRRVLQQLTHLPQHPQQREW